MSYFDVPERRLEPPDVETLEYCGCCGGEIYAGDTVYRIDGQFIHEDCLYDYAKDYFSDCKEEIEQEVQVRTY